MIAEHYGHLGPEAEAYEIGLLDAFDETYGHVSDTAENAEP